MIGALPQLRLGDDTRPAGHGDAECTLGTTRMEFRAVARLHGERRLDVLPEWENDVQLPRGGWIAAGGRGAITRPAPDGTPR